MKVLNIVDMEGKQIRIRIHSERYCVEEGCIIYQKEDDESTNYFIPLHTVRCFSISTIE